MGRKNVLVKNYFFDTIVVTELGAEICSMMMQTDGILKEASGVIGGIAALLGSVTSKARCGALADACAAAQKEIESVDFSSYGQRVNNGLLNLADHNEYISDQFIKAMKDNSERVQGFGSGCRSLSALLEYVGGNISLNIQSGIERAESNISEIEAEENEPLTRTEILQLAAAKMSGTSLDAYGKPRVNSAEEGKKATAYYRYLNDMKCGVYSNSEIAAIVAGVSIYNGVPGINCAADSKNYMNVWNQLQPQFVGYLSYGSDGITQSGEAGYYRLYSAPTLSTKHVIYNCGDLYDEYNVEPCGALQSFCEKEVYNMGKSGITYGGQEPNIEKGTLIYNGIERHAIAIGPTLQNPDFRLNDKKEIVADDMIYGTCVDIAIELEGERYYIPAIIVDVKAHTAEGGYGIFQTGYDFAGNYEDTGKIGPIVEWYVVKETEEGNKSSGLGQFNSNSSIIIYQEEVLR